MVGPFAKRPAVDDLDGGKKRAQIIAAPVGSVDLKKALGVGGTGEAFAVSTARLVNPLAFEGYLLLSGDDGIEVEVDGEKLLAVDEGHPPLDDVEVVPLKLSAGQHRLRVWLHQRGGPWEHRLRLVGKDLLAARGLSYGLPQGTDADDLARRLVSLKLERKPTALGWEPVLHVRADNGVPRATDTALTLVGTAGGQPAGGLFRLQPGGLPVPPNEPANHLDVFLPTFHGEGASALEAGAWTLEATLVGKTQKFLSIARAEVRLALAKIVAARHALAAEPSITRDPVAAEATLDYLASRLASYASGDDRDGEAQADDARRAGEFADALARKEDPFETLRGGIRVAHRSSLDGQPSPFALYLPKGAPLGKGADRPTEKLPLVIALHGLNGKPMNMLRWVFGRDEDGRDGEWEDRHPGVFPAFPAIVIAPMAHFNTGFRDVAEVDVVQIIAWAKKNYPVDEARVSITGPSMGGIGSGGIGLRHAELFSAAAPLCGYHTYFLRNDMRPEPKLSWETAVAEHRSNYRWAENGLYLPMTIVHGKKDTPVANSGLLIERYERLGYRMIHEHPDEGHHVWPLFYDDLKGLRWLTSHKRPKSPPKIVWKTDAHRYDGGDWLRVTKLEKVLSFGEVTATAKREGEGSTIDIKTSGLRGLHLERDGENVADVVTVKIAGKTLRFDKAEAVDLRRVGGEEWEKGAFDLTGQKRKGAEGPIRDVLHDPLIFVVGTADPALTEANRLVAKQLARLRNGVIIDYPIVDDVDLDAARAAGASLVLVGGPASNRWTAKADAGLPIHVRPNEVRVGEKRFEGADLGALFVFPSPFAPKDTPRSIIVAAGASLGATLRIPAVPELVPDWVVFDRGILPAKGQQLSTPGKYVALGMFDESWKLAPLP